MKKVKMAKDTNQIDRFERKMLDILQTNGRISVSELARRVGLSKSPCQTRLKRLIDNEVILGFRAVLNPRQLDLEHVAFTEVKLSDTREEALNAFNRAIQTIPEIDQCHMIAGPFDYLLKVRSKDIANYRKILGETISTLPYVSSTSTYIAMQSVKDTG